MANRGRKPNKSAIQIPPPPTLGNPTSIRLAAEFAYEWGWPLVNANNRARKMERLLQWVGREHYRVEGWPIGYNSFTLQTERTSQKERLMCCPNSRLLYGGGAFRLGAKGAVAQVPKELEEEKIVWLYSFYDARSLHFGGLSSHYESAPGFYLIVGPDWDRTIPKGIQKKNIIENPEPTDLVFLAARIFMDPPAVIPPWLHKVNCYPTSQYQPNVYRTVAWEHVDNCTPPVPAPPEELKYVDPLDFFRDDFPRALERVKAQTGEAGIYACIDKLLDLFAHYPRIRPICLAAAVRIENTVIRNGMLWRNNGVAVGNGWHFSEHSGQWPVDKYALRTASAKSNLFQNRRKDTHYYLTDDDSKGNPLHGSNTYTITFEGGMPPAMGPCSITVYSQNHFLCVEKNSISLDSGGPRVVIAGPTKACDIGTPPGEPFCLYLRAYWMDESKMPWLPPKVEKR